MAVAPGPQVPATGAFPPLRRVFGPCPPFTAPTSQPVLPAPESWGKPL